MNTALPYPMERVMAGLLGYCMATIAGMAQMDCIQRYDDAKALFDNGERKVCIQVLDTALNRCAKDRDVYGRMLYLKSLAEAGEDSLDRMRRDLERLYRSDRHFVIKAYDPLIKGRTGEAELYGAWENLHTDLRKDLGRWRAGVSVSFSSTIIRTTTDRKVLASDEEMDYGTSIGWDAGGTMEWEIIPNLALTASAGYGVTGFEATNGPITYKENMTRVPMSVGVKKCFWLDRSAFVPFARINGGFGWLLRDEAQIERVDGQDTRYLRSINMDRLAERRQDQFWLEGALGVSRKAGHTVLSAEVAYDHALTTLTLDSAPYTNAELLADYYYVDNTLFMHAVVLRITAQYVLDYHNKNRIHP